MNPLIGDHLLDGDLGVGEGRIGRGLITRLPVEDVVVVLPRSVGAFHLVLEVFADHRRVGRHRLHRIDQNRQFLIVDVDQIGAVGGDIAVGRNDEGDFLVLVEDAILREYGLNVPGKRRHVMKAERLQVGGGQNRQHAGKRLGPRSVDRLDLGMAVGRTGKVAVDHPGQFEIVDIVALALNEPDVLDALALAAESFEFLGPLGRGGDGGVVHSAASWKGTPAILAAAY